MAYWNNEEDFDGVEELANLDEDNGDYSNWQVEQMANALLREDSNKELCRKCGIYGAETGDVESAPQLDAAGTPQVDGQGNVCYMDFPELSCKNGHRWYLGEGKRRGIDGSNPILFENHLRERRRREIYTEVGTPDPALTQDRFGRPIHGLYNRSHPDGRKINTPEQRRKSGASYYR